MDASKKQVLLLACMAVAVFASGATPPIEDETLDEVVVTAERERERPRRRTTLTTSWSNVFGISRTMGATVARLGIRNARHQQDVRFRRTSKALRLAPEAKPAPDSFSTVQLTGNRLSGIDRSNVTVMLALDDNIDEADGLPASISFGPRSALVNLDYLRLRDTDGKTLFSVMNAINSQTRRCEQGYVIVEDGWDIQNGFVLLSDSLAECRRTERGREGDLLFADGLPEKLRQEVLQVYGPISVGLGNRLGSEPGLVFVAWWPNSPHTGLRFERSWDRSSLLLFNGPEWQRGLNPHQQQALQDAFSTEQIGRRFSEIDKPSSLIEAAARYLLLLFRAEQNDNTIGWLANALPLWIASCFSHMDDRATAVISRSELSGIECGLLVQFVYDAVARAQSAGRANLFSTWRRLLNASRNRGTDGATEADFLASSTEAHRIVAGLLDGTVEWSRFSAELADLGVGLRINLDEPDSIASVLSLTYFQK